MSDRFDPYHRWLSIPPQEQPPHHYRLLSLNVFESDPAVIESAADRQMAHVRNFQAGQHGAESQRLLNEIAVARGVLLDPQRKANYDAKLRAMLAAAEAKRRPPQLTPASPPLTAMNVAEPSAPAKGGALPVGLLVAAGVSLLLAIAGVGVGAMWWNRPTPAIALNNGQDPNAAPAARPAPVSETPVPGGSNPVDAANPAPIVEVTNANTELPLDPAPMPGDNAGPATVPAPVEPVAEVRSEGPVSTEEEDEPAPVAVSPEPAAPRRLPVPEKDVRDRKRAEIIGIFPFDTARTAADKGKLAEELLDTARGTTSDLPAQFALLNLAREQAVEAGQLQTAFEAIDLLAERFEFDADTVRVVSLQEAAKAPLPPAEKRGIVLIGMELIDKFVAADEFEKATALSDRLVAIARPMRDAELLKSLGDQRTTADALAADYRTLQTALETLKLNADDREANLAAGRYLVFTKQDWQAGLAYLAKGSDALLAAAAGLEIAGAKTPAEQEALADAWWTAADAQTDSSVRDLSRARGGKWYRTALPQLSGLSKAKAERRVAEAPELKEPSGEPDPRSLADLANSNSGTPAAETGPTIIKRPNPKDFFVCVLGRYRDYFNSDRFYPVVNLDIPDQTLWNGEYAERLQGVVEGSIGYEGSARFYIPADGEYEVRGHNIQVTLDGYRLDDFRRHSTRPFPFKKGLHTILLSTHNHGQPFLGWAEVSIVEPESETDIPLVNTWADIELFMRTPVANRAVIELSGWQPTEENKVEINLR